jgi:hypothetical protein
MPGGLLNIIAYGNQNIILNGNPTKTFFKSVYAKYTNFGLQKYRIDFNGERMLQLNESSKFTFKIPRYAELLMNTYLVVTIPNIWSPFYKNGLSYNPYEFKWIEDLGALMIEQVTLSSGGQILQQFSGDYIKNRIERNEPTNKKEQFYKMTGNISELNDPAYFRNGYYPNSRTTQMDEPPEPSIYGRKLYIPLPFWFSNSSKFAFPLVCLQYNELIIDVTLRPIRQLFTVLDVTGAGQRIRPDFGSPLYQMYRFLQVPPIEDYTNLQNTWASDVNIIATYAFLSEEETKVFAANEQKYLFLDVKETNYKHMVGTKRVKIETNNLVSNWFWFLRRSDIYERNEWSNYTNWKYKDKPNVGLSFVELRHNDELESFPITQYPVDNNVKHILIQLSLLLDGKYRENEFSSDIYRYIEKYDKCLGNSDDGLYSYSFSLNTSPYETQPCGAMNLGKFKDVFMDILTITPDIDETQTVSSICDDEGNIIGYIDTDPTKIYKYSFDMVLFEERYNVIRFMAGNVALVYAR